ncbi:MAG: hypothetical protein PHT58_03250 [Eubacteriales bacterium]|nr:hypothetical protein [Eubacteriales bacterium]
MKRFSAIVLSIIYLSVLLCFGIPSSYAMNTKNISLSLTVDPNAELSTGGELSWIRGDITNGGAEAFLPSSATISCSAIGFDRSLDIANAIQVGTSGEFYLRNVDIPDSGLGVPLTFVLTWTDVAYDIGGFPIETIQTAEATITIERFVEPVITIYQECAVELAKPNDKVTIVYTLENSTKFDMYNLVLYDSEISPTTIPLTTTSLLAGTTQTITFQAIMSDKDLVSQPMVTYSVRNKAAQTKATNPLLISCAIIELNMSIQTFAATEDGVEFAITVKNTGTQPIVNIQLYDEINSIIGEPFDLDAGQSKSLSITIPAAASQTQTRYVSFHAIGTDCFEEEYVYYEQTSYPIIPYVDSSSINIHLSVECDVVNQTSATIKFEIINRSEVTILNASLVELEHFVDQPIATFAQLNSGSTAFLYDFTLDQSITSLSFVLKAFDPSGAPCQTDIIVLDLSVLMNEEGTVPQMGTEHTIGGQYDSSAITNAIRTILIVVIVIVVVGLIIVAILYVLEKKMRPQVAANENTLSHTTAHLFDDELLESDEADSHEPITNNEEEILPFDSMGYIAPAKLRYFSSDASNRSPVKPYSAPPIVSTSVDTPVIQTQSQMRASDIIATQDTLIKQISLPVSKFDSSVVAQRNGHQKGLGARSLDLIRKPRRLPLTKNEMLRVKAK